MQIVLFPGFVFCRSTFSDRMQMLRVPGVSSIVTAGRNPVIITDSEMEAIRRSTARRPAYRPGLVAAGQTLGIGRGDTAVRGVVAKIKNTRTVVVSIQALGISAAIDLDSDGITLAD